MLKLPIFSLQVVYAIHNSNIYAAIYYFFVSPWICVPVVLVVVGGIATLINRKKSNESVWVGEEDSHNTKKTPLFWRLVFLAGVAITSYLTMHLVQLLFMPINNFVVNALGVEAAVAEVSKHNRNGIHNDDALKCYKLSYVTMNGTEHLIDRCEPIYSHSHEIYYLPYYPEVIAIPE
ncbi:hypothetical protein [Taylorella equigenitalis]|uniref:hypothetical protein n=1 Tax=Taylorella equigenitalis TaxID=29575 RepID=UPI001CEF8C6F|nr:hypothetical protein [Taylorella equigenitalis]